MAHFTCVSATVDELRATLDRCATPGIENVLALRGDPPQGQEGWTKTEGGLELLARARRADGGRVPASRSARPASRRPTSTRPRPRTTCAPQGEGRRRRALPHHPALLRQRRLLRVRRPRARDRHRRPDHARASCRSRTSTRSSGSPSMCGATIPTTLLDELEAPGDDPRRWPSSASPTRRCSAPSCWPAARPGIHFYTLNRSPGDARDPRRAAPLAPVGARRAPVWARRSAPRIPATRSSMSSFCGHAPASRRRAGSARRRCRPGGRCPTPQAPRNQRQPLMRSLRSSRWKTSAPSRDAVVLAQLLAHAVDVDLERRADVAGEAHDERDTG